MASASAVTSGARRDGMNAALRRLAAIALDSFDPNPGVRERMLSHDDER
jgi:hypothetical protein